jgi:hypothetical protein
MEMVTKKAKKTALKILPKKMSALIKVALVDLKKAEKDANIVIDMNRGWLEKSTLKCTLRDGTEISEHKVCVMCLAGTIMAYSFGALKDRSWEQYRSPEHYEKNTNQLRALDSLREGFVDESAYWLELPNAKELRKLNTDIPEYDRGNPEPFHKAMNKLRDKLIKAGL